MQSGMQAKGQRKEAIIVNQKSTGLSSLQLYKPMKISCLERNQAAVRSFYSSAKGISTPQMRDRSSPIETLSPDGCSKTGGASRYALCYFREAFVFNQ